MNTLLFIGGLGGWEVLLIVAIVLILFGAKKIPELARGLGTGIREFKNATTEVQKEVERDSAENKKSTATAAATAKPPTESATAVPTPPADHPVEEVKVEEEEKAYRDTEPKP